MRLHARSTSRETLVLIYLRIMQGWRKLTKSLFLNRLTMMRYHKLNATWAEHSPAMPILWRSLEVEAITNCGEYWRRFQFTNARYVMFREWTLSLPNCCSTAPKLLPFGSLWHWLKSVICVTFTGLNSQDYSSIAWFSKCWSRQIFLTCISA